MPYNGGGPPQTPQNTVSSRMAIFITQSPRYARGLDNLNAALSMAAAAVIKLRGGRTSSPPPAPSKHFSSLRDRGNTFHKPKMIRASTLCQEYVGYIHMALAFACSPPLTIFQRSPWWWRQPQSESCWRGPR